MYELTIAGKKGQRVMTWPDLSRDLARLRRWVGKPIGYRVKVNPDLLLPIGHFRTTDNRFRLTVEIPKEG